MRLIDADVAKKAVHEEFDECLVWDESGEYTSNVIEKILEALPTVDAVPVMRCKDCKFSMSGIDKYNERYILCQLHERSYGVIDDGFCNWAERKEGRGE